MQLRSFEASSGYEDALAKAADECGIYRDYWDIFARRHDVSPQVRAAILKALGWDTSSTESLDQERRHRLERALATPLPKTAVVSRSNPIVPVTLPNAAAGSLCLDLLLEDGQRLAGSLEICQLQHVRDIHVHDRRWTMRNLTLPAEVPLGYHRLRITINVESEAETNVRVCPDRAYNQERVQEDAKTAG
jgi:4-alpha-glucanotransferase